MTKKSHGILNILVTGGLLLAALVSLLALVYIFIVDKKTPLEYTPYFLGFSFFSFLLFLFALAFTFENKQRLLLICVSVGVSLLALDAIVGSLKLTNPHNFYVNRQRVAKKMGVEFDKRSKLEVIQDLKKMNITAVPPARTQTFVETNGFLYSGKPIFPFGGISNAKVVLCNEEGAYARYVSDEHGFNNPNHLYIPENVDIMLIGDSFTHGCCVDPGQDIAGQLRALGIPKTLTLGVGGVGPLIELAILSEYGAKLHPKKVYWLYFEGNDLEDLEVERQSSYLFRYFDDDFSQNLVEKQKIIDEILSDYIEGKLYNILAAEDITQHFDLKGVFKLRHLRAQLMLNVPKKKPFPKPDGLFEAILMKANERVQNWGGELYFVYLPEWTRLQNKRDDNFRNKKEVMQVVKRLGINILDIGDDFSEHADPLSLFPLRIDSHYNASGYKVVAQRIKQSFTEYSVIPIPDEFSALLPALPHPSHVPKRTLLGLHSLGA